MNERSTTRVRFAPSPTGFLHVGGLRTALYNFLYARKNSGVFVLRIEDTDRSRAVEGAAKNLLEVLQWAGLVPDEGPNRPGSYGPYVQSERLHLYRDSIEKLLASGSAYRCFCSPERLDEMRKAQEKQKLPFIKYDRRCLALSREEIEGNLRRGLPHVVRMRVPEGEPVGFRDMIHGDLSFAAEQIDDQVLMKSDGYPTYHFANVVDDHTMEISHVIRGEEWLPSTPKHVLLYRFFGWEPPVFAHLPLLLNPDRSKLSKRQGDVAVEDFRAKGYLSEALINFVALLGWNPGTTQELFSLEELVGLFSLEQVNRSGAIFNLEKLTWLNFQHLRKRPESDVLAMLKEALKASPFAATQPDDAYLLSVIRAMRERVTFVRDFFEKSPYFFAPPASYDQEAVKKRWKKETPAHLEALAAGFSRLENPSAQAYEHTLKSCAAALAAEPGEMIHPLRLARQGCRAAPVCTTSSPSLGKRRA